MRLFQTNDATRRLRLGAILVNFNGWKYSRAEEICKAGIRPPEKHRDDVSGVAREVRAT